MSDYLSSKFVVIIFQKMNKNTFKEISPENLEQLSFDDLFDFADNYINYLTNNLEPIGNNLCKKECVIQLINLLESKVLDNLISKAEIEEFVAKQLKLEENKINYNPLKIDYEKNLGKLRKNLNRLKTTKQQFNQNVKKNHLLKTYEHLKKISKDIINLEEYEFISNKPNENLFFVETVTKTVEQKDLFLLRITGRYSTKTTRTLKMNPNYRNDEKLNKLYRKFIKDVPILIEEAINKTEKKIENLTKEINAINLARKVLSEEDKTQIRSRTLKNTEYEVNIKSGGQVNGRYRKIVNLRSKKRKIFNNDEVDLPFEIFPEGEWTRESIVNRFKRNGVFVSENEIKRIEKIRELFKPDRHAIGIKNSRGYDGYYVFIFDNLDKVIAENPLKDNATYLIKGSWKEILDILKLTKMKVLRHPKSRRIIHRNEGQWLRDLKFEFYWF